MIHIQHVEQALALPQFDGVMAQMRMAPLGRAQMKPNQAPRPAAVLVLFYPSQDGLQILLTKRTAHLRGHSGQVSFPGGKPDPEDGSAEVTALRETCEELGICDSSKIHLLGRLTKLWIPPSNFDVLPIVGYFRETPTITPNPGEVAQVLHLPLNDLLDDGLKSTTEMRFGGTDYDVPYYDVDDQVVWGATCMILSELEQRLRVVLRR